MFKPASIHTPPLIVRALLATAVCVFLLSSAGKGWSAEIIVLGDARLKPVADVIAGIRKTAPSPPKIIAPADVKGIFSKTVAAEDAKVIIALGKEAIEKSLQLPPAIPVICSLVIAPPKTSRPNVACALMATPVNEYMALLRQYFPALKKVAVFTNQETQRSLPGGYQGQLAVYQADTSFELIAKLRQTSGFDALLLLPDVSLLTATALDEVFLYSFRNRVPVLGVSEKHVKQGSLFALVFDAQTIGRQLGEKAADVLSGSGLDQSHSFTSRKFNVFLNADTAQKMGVAIPDELLRRAQKVYP